MTIRMLQLRRLVYFSFMMPHQQMMGMQCKAPAAGSSWSLKAKQSLVMLPAMVMASLQFCRAASMAATSRQLWASLAATLLQSPAVTKHN